MTDCTCAYTVGLSYRLEYITRMQSEKKILEGISIMLNYNESEHSTTCAGAHCLGHALISNTSQPTHPQHQHLPTNHHKEKYI